MKKLVLYSVLTVCAAIAPAALVVAQAPAGVQDPAARVDEKTVGATIRASQLTGMNIRNSAGEKVGDINDLLIDARTGRIRYAAVSYGGFLGIGDKLFAVPYEAFRFRPAVDDPSNILLVLDVTKEQLDGARGFDQDNWPDFGDRNYTADLDRRYKVQRSRPGADKLGADNLGAQSRPQPDR